MAEREIRTDGKLDTIIGKGTKVEGTITVEGSTRIDGILTGKLISNDIVTVGPTGEVKADIKAKSIIIGGKVFGNIESSEKIEIQARAEFRGDLIAKSLLIEHGAVFHGNSNMAGGSPQKNIVTPPSENK
ncbi:MAG: polymer-forming cytoskeletal protein [candidate division Zixibacteria bacterium]|nr:polymer-forming cytoskeletal protein [candidate division Zixibacteria bacterium]